jgi:hypothetical protein
MEPLTCPGCLLGFHWLDPPPAGLWLGRLPAPEPVPGRLTVFPPPLMLVLLLMLMSLLLPQP